MKKQGRAARRLTRMAAAAASGAHRSARSSSEAPSLRLALRAGVCHLKSRPTILSFVVLPLVFTEPDCVAQVIHRVDLRRWSDARNMRRLPVAMHQTGFRRQV